MRARRYGAANASDRPPPSAAIATDAREMPEPDATGDEDGADDEREHDGRVEVGLDA